MAGPNMARDESLAGQSVKQGNYTITYNENGYATKAVNDGGKSATSAKMTTHANDSAAHQEAYKAAQNNDWDAVGVAVNKIGMQDPNKNMGAANQYMQELQDQFKYNAKDYYNNQYDKAYGAGSASVYDMTNGAIKSYGELESLIGAPKAQSLTAQYGASASVPSGGQASPNDMTKYLEDMFAQNLQAELSALRNAYDSNVAELEAQNDRIAEQYRAARNQAAVQNALESQRMNEYALAQGLNTGTSGQMALAQNMAYQNNLGNIWAQEAQKQADVDLALAQLMRDYNANVNQTTAEINAQRAEALYDEMVRQQELAAAAEAARIKQEQADREWAYMLEQDELDRQLQYAQLSAKNKSGGSSTPQLTYNQVMDAIDRGEFTPGVLASYEAIMGVPYGQQTAPTGTGNYDAILRDIVEASETGGYSANKLIDMIDGYVVRGELSENEAVEIARQFGLQ